MTAIVLKNPRIGFLNFDPRFASLMAADRAALASLFKACEPPSALNPCHVLFVYGKINVDGTMQGTSHHLRDIIKQTRAYIVILASDNASDNPTDLLKNGFPWKDKNKWGADILLVGDRNGENFQIQFKKLFSLMFEGTPMGIAFVQLFPQTPFPLPNAPGILWLMTYGCWTFENSTPENPKIAASIMEELATGYSKDGVWHNQLADLILKKVISLDKSEVNFHIETALSLLRCALRHWMSGSSYGSG